MDAQQSHWFASIEIAFSLYCHHFILRVDVQKNSASDFWAFQNDFQISYGFLCRGAPANHHQVGFISK